MAMHHQKMIVLGLVAIGKKYGFEIEEFIAQTEMKRWAEIGNSTIYKVLKDLEHDNALRGEKIASDKGPAKNGVLLDDAWTKAAYRIHFGRSQIRHDSAT